MHMKSEYMNIGIILPPIIVKSFSSSSCSGGGPQQQQQRSELILRDRVGNYHKVLTIKRIIDIKRLTNCL